MDLTPKAGSVDLMLGTSGYVPGWTEKGYPNLTGYAWYRLRLRVTNASQPLWLKMPGDCDDIYQVYANGRKIGQFGGFSGNHRTLYFSKPASFALPSPGPDGTIDLAMRFYMSPSTPFTNIDVGGCTVLRFWAGLYRATTANVAAGRTSTRLVRNAPSDSFSCW